MNGFRQWLAIRVGGNDTDIWPGMVFFDPIDGIKIETVSFGRAKEPSDFESSLITGYLDYQTPVSFIDNFVYERAGMTLAAGLSARSKFGLVSNYMLKGVHLPSAEAAVFRGFICEPASFHQWYDRKAAETGFAVIDGMPAPSISLSSPIRELFSLSYGVAEVSNYNSIGSVHGTHPVRNRTRLKIELSEACNFESILALVSAVQTTFNFIVGARFPYADHTLLSTIAGAGSESTSNADLYVASRQKTIGADADHRSMSTRGSTTVDAPQLLEFCSDPTKLNLRYKMGLVLASEMDELDIGSAYGELIGALEDLDIRLNGRGGKGNTLKRRLERLVAPWTAEGFRGSPDLEEVVKHRNIKPHGRGHDLSRDHFQYMYTLTPFLSALLRYHLCSLLGFTADDVNRSFTTSYIRYGQFAKCDTGG